MKCFVFQRVLCCFLRAEQWMDLRRILPPITWATSCWPACCWKPWCILGKMSRILESSTSLLLHTTLLISVYTTFKTRRFKNTFLLKWNKHTESYLKQNIKNTWKPEEIRSDQMRSDVAWSKTAVEFNIREFKGGGGMFWIMWYWILVILINSGYVFRYLFFVSDDQRIHTLHHMTIIFH